WTRPARTGCPSRPAAKRFYGPPVPTRRRAGMTERLQTRIYDRWAQLRFSIIGHLLADPPARGALQSAIDELARREWRHPVTLEPVKFGASTIQRWYYRALRERQDPVAALRRKPRQDAGRQTSVSAPLRQALHAQYAAHPNWSAQLHWDNLAALAANQSALRPRPSWPSGRSAATRPNMWDPWSIGIATWA